MASPTDLDLQAIRKLGAEVAELIRERLTLRTDAREVLLQFVEGLRVGFADVHESTDPADGNREPTVALDPQLARVANAKSAHLTGTYGPNNPRAARIVSVSENIQTGECAVVFDVDGSGLGARTGDELALCPRNDPEEVRRILRAFNVRGVENVTYANGSGPAWRVLLEEVEIASISEEMLDYLRLKLASREQVLLVEEFIAANQPSLLALLRRFPNLSLKLPEVLPTMRPLRATSALVADWLAPGDAHLRGVLSNGAKLRATTSGITLSVGAWVPIYIVPNPAGYLSDEGELPLVLITDELGAHLARSYVAERRKKGHRGRAWILAIGPHVQPELIDELTAWQRDGLLTRLDILGSSGLGERPERTATQEMLWRWFVDRSAFFVLGADEAATSRLNAMVFDMLVAGGKREPQWFDSPMAERRECNLYRTINLA